MFQCLSEPSEHQDQFHQMLWCPGGQHFNTPVPGTSRGSFSGGVLSCYWVKRSYPQNSVWCIVWGRYLEQASDKNQYLLSPEEWQSSVNMPTRARPANNLSPVFHIKRTRWCQWRISENMCSNKCTMANSCFPPDYFKNKVLFFPSLFFTITRRAAPVMTERGDFHMRFCNPPVWEIKYSIVLKGSFCIYLQSATEISGSQLCCCLCFFRGNHSRRPHHHHGSNLIYGTGVC